MYGSQRYHLNLWATRRRYLRFSTLQCVFTVYRSLNIYQSYSSDFLRPGRLWSVTPHWAFVLFSPTITYTFGRIILQYYNGLTCYSFSLLKPVRYILYESLQILVYSVFNTDTFLHCVFSINPQSTFIERNHNYK